MFLYLSPDVKNDRDEFEVNMHNDARYTGRLQYLMQFKEMANGADFKDINFDVEPFWIPYDKYPRKYACAYNDSLKKVRFEFCGKSFLVSKIKNIT